MHWICGAFLGVGLALASGCSEETPDRVEQLRALGYVAWDEHADTALRGVTPRV